MIELLLLKQYSSKPIPIATLIGLLEQYKHHFRIVFCLDQDLGIYFLIVLWLYEAKLSLLKLASKVSVGAAALVFQQIYQQLIKGVFVIQVVLRRLTMFWGLNLCMR